jgi:hypothetical protein
MIWNYDHFPQKNAKDFSEICTFKNKFISIQQILT